LGTGSDKLDVSTLQLAGMKDLRTWSLLEDSVFAVGWDVEKLLNAKKKKKKKRRFSYTASCE
jgi:hypothetical protein